MHELIKTTAVAGLAAALAATGAAVAQDYDVLIRGGRVLDGSGVPWRYADVAISDDRIVAVGHVPEDATAELVVDATGRYVTPGFIDPHSHAAPAIETAELAHATPVLLQGITTVLLNPDGGGPADLAPQAEAIETHTPGVNAALTIGHNAVRRFVMDDANRAPSEGELEQMRELVRGGMEAGAFGLSSGPFYIPGKYSDTDEIASLAEVAAAYPGAFHISHIRDESSYDIGVQAAVEEVIEVSRQTGIPGIVTHFKMLGPFVWGESETLVRVINEAREEGLEIWSDQYPYAASGSGLQPALVPGWAQEGGSEAISRRLQDPEQRALIREEMELNLERRAGANAIQIRRYEPDPSLEGRRLDDIARELGQDPLDTAIDMLIEGGAAIVSFNMNEDDVERIMRQPWNMTSSDGGLTEFGEGAVHPRNYGAFPRKIREYVMERGVITLEQAVYSSSGLPATVLGITDRGFIRPGAYADILIFDPEEVRDTATYDEPHSYSEGMHYVFVNGRPAVAEGEVTQDRHGRLLQPVR